jgi:hypothetical protein
MKVFRSERLVPIAVGDLEPVAQELAAHFKQRNYQVECSEVADGQWEVGITRGGIFKTVVGLKSALKIQLEARPKGTMVRAGAGIFGKQAAPTAIAIVTAWPIALPVVLAQVWGIVREAGLDNEAIRVVELSLNRVQRLTGLSDNGDKSEFRARDSVPNGPPARSAARPAGVADMRPQPGHASPGEFCTSCGRQLEGGSRFCAGCGQPTPAAAREERGPG